MPRPEKRRFVVGPPRAGLFKPAGVPARQLEEVSLTLDGYEAIRLVDLEGMDHSGAAEELGVSRPTLTRILTRARRTVAEALAGGKALSIEGGAVTHDRPAREGEGIMKVVISAEGRDLDSRVDERFGRAAFLLLVDSHMLELEVINNAPNTAAVQGAGIQAASAIAATTCEAVISGNVGPKAFATLDKAGIAVYRAGDFTVREAVAALTRGELERQQGASVRGHW